MIVSARSHLSAGLAAGLVLAATGAAVVAPTAGPPPIRVASPAVALTAAFPQLPVVDFSGVAETPGDWIINAYGVIQPWVAYGVELFAWATEWLPWPIGLLAPQADIIYSGWQPFAESVVYSFAFLVDGEFAGAINRVPPAGETRSNLHVGGTAKPTQVTVGCRDSGSASSRRSVHSVATAPPSEWPADRGGVSRVACIHVSWQWVVTVQGWRGAPCQTSPCSVSSLCIQRPN